jgi:ribose transport system permease protein
VNNSEKTSRLVPITQVIKKSTGNNQVMVFFILALLMILAQILSPGYLKMTHIAGILRLASFMGIAAIGQNLTILAGGIDLSIANTISFGNIIAAQLMMGKNEYMLRSLIAVLIMGLIVGIINGFGIRILKIPPFIMTLGVGTVIQGIFLIYTKGAPKGNAAPLLKSICGRSMFGIVSGIVIIWIIMAACIMILLRKITYGRKIYSVGSNEQAAKFSGINTGWVIFSAYIISAVIAAFSGFLLVGYTGTSYLDVGSDYNTKTIAAVIIGGTAISGGKGSYIGTIAGAIIMTILDDFLTIVNIPEAGRQIAQGIIILLLVLIYNREKKKNGKS